MNKSKKNIRRVPQPKVWQRQLPARTAIRSTIQEVVCKGCGDYAGREEMTFSYCPECWITDADETHAQQRQAAAKIEAPGDDVVESE